MHLPDTAARLPGRPCLNLVLHSETAERRILDVHQSTQSGRLRVSSFIGTSFESLFS